MYSELLISIRRWILGSLGSTDIIGDAYEYMIAMFASNAGKKGGEFFTPSQVSELVASLVMPKENDRIYDEAVA